MKKILIATTALVGTAGMAAAEINFSGSARFGLTYLEDRVDEAGRDAETVLEQRLRFQVQGVTEADNGLKFEARFRAEAGEDEDNSISGGGFGAAGFAVSTGGFRLDVGNVSDVIDSGDVINYFGYGVGFTSFLEQNANSVGIPASGFSSGSQESSTIKLRYTAGDFTVALSYQNNEDADIGISSVVGGATVIDNSVEDLEEYMIGASYSFGDYNVGVAFGNQDGFSDAQDAAGTGGTVVDNDFWAIGFDGSVGALDFAILITDSDLADDVTVGASLDYDINDATSIRFVVSDGGATGSDTAVGVGFRHSLGGGVTLAGGIGENNAGLTQADLGVSFSF